MVVGYMEAVGYPAYLIWVLAIAKIAGVVALWIPTRSSIKEWAYAGFFYLLSLAFLAHIYVGDGQHMGALVGLIVMLMSYVLYNKQLKK
ncbi:MAG: DoxX family protein [Candidatus Pacebacteria bacterium]|nr:DoxX family protein [Candidatus Paceibacterota bacterium]